MRQSFAFTHKFPHIYAMHLRVEINSLFFCKLYLFPNYEESKKGRKQVS